MDKERFEEHLNALQEKRIKAKTQASQNYYTSLIEQLQYEYKRGLI